MRTSGFILWQGASLLNGAPIVALAIAHSDNAKTGDMVQTYILRRDIAPHTAVKSGEDSAVCGNCPLAHGNGCYVVTFQGPLSVWNAFRRGSYSLADWIAPIGAGRQVRLGAYGDPAAVPTNVWRDLLRDAAGWTGYTHQWRNTPDLRSLCMASADTEADAMEARSLGWRTYRIADAPASRAEIQCPNDTHRTQCADCGLCNGATSKARSIVIAAHGARASKARRVAEGVTA